MKLTGNNPIHHLIIFWMSTVRRKGHTLVQVCHGIGVHVDAGLSMDILYLKILDHMLYA